MRQDSDLFKTALQVFNKRKQICCSRTDEKTLNHLLGWQYDFFDKAEAKLKQIQYLPYSQMVFLADLFIKTSRVWEMNDLDSNNQLRFPCYSQKRFCEISRHLQSIWNLAYQLNWVTKPYKNDILLQNVKKRLLKNFSILEIIIKNNVKIIDLEIYIALVLIFEYSGTSSELYLYGFTSFDGKYIYLSTQNDKNQSDQSQILEQQIIDGFYLWIIKNTNPFYISSEDAKLMKNGFMLEQGDYYLSMIYCSEFIDPSPFRMSIFNKRMLF